MKYYYPGLFGIISFFVVSSFLMSPQTKQQSTATLAFANSSMSLSQPREGKPMVNTRNGSFAVNVTAQQLTAEAAADRFNTWLGLNDQYTFEKVRERTDDLGITHINYQEYYKGIPVEGFMVMLHLENGKATYFNGRILKMERPKLQNSIAKEQALAIAKDHFDLTHLFEEYPVETVLTKNNAKTGATAVLAYKIRLISADPLLMQEVYIDAGNGDIVKSINLIKTFDVNGGGETYYEGHQNFTVDSHNGVYRLRDNARGVTTFDGSHITGFSYNGFVGAKDFESTTTDFSGGLFHTFKVDTVPAAWIPTDTTLRLYLSVKDKGDEVVYTSGTFTYNNAPIVFNNIDVKMYNSPYKAEIYRVQNNNDSLLMSYEVNLTADTISWSQAGGSGVYMVNKIGNPALDVHWGMEMTHDFYLNVFNRDSYDDNGGLIKQYVSPPSNMIPGLPNNAFALQSPFNIMIYGLGDGTIMHPVVAIDVQAHEFTHLVIGSNGNGGLTYSKESGALNESFADIFGTCVEFYATANPDWEVGGDVIIGADNMRSMSDPNNWGGYSHQPDTYQGNYWLNTNSNYDNGGVHINSGVQNHWFYLLSEGGSGTNDNGDVYNVTGIGINKAREIAYRNLMTYLTPNATYWDAYLGSLQAAKDLYGLPSAEYTAVSEAWYAVGIGDNPHQYCTGATVLTAANGTFEDGSAVMNYVNNAHCTWLIQPNNALSISLSFLDFNTEKDADYVVVYDGADASAPVLASFSGDSISGTVTSSGGSMFVEFYSNQTIKASGWTAEYTTILGVEDQEILDQKLSIYPNPAKDYFVVESNLQREAQLQIFSLIGKQVHTLQTLHPGSNAIDISDLGEGIYFVEMTQGNHTHVEKLIVR